MKLSRKLVPAIAMLLVSAVMLSTASFAWFSMNTTVSATNMKVQAQAMGSLIIADNIPGPASSKDVLEFTKNATVLKDVMRDAGATSGFKTIPENLRSHVDSQTGVYNTTTAQAAAGEGSIWQQIAVGTDGYYVDFVAYIAARSDAIAAGNKLQAKVTTAAEGYYNGIAVDFYVQAVNANAEGVLGTEPYGTKDAYAAPSYVTSVVAAHANGTAADIYTGAIPVAPGTANIDDRTTEGYIKIVMRLYIDGNETNYVKNANWTGADVPVAVEFKLVPVSGS